jgi:hypothetical protein
MLLRAIRYLAHRFAGPLIVDIDVGAHARIGLVLLLVRIETVIVALVLAWNIVRQFVKLEALAAHLVPIHRFAETREDRVPVMLAVVDRHVPLRDRHVPAHRDDEGVGEH